MDDHNPTNWRGMFEQNRATGRGIGRDGISAPPPSPLERDEPPLDEELDLDLATYKPWVLQRGRSRPAMMLHLRRFEPKSGLWMGWQLAYPHLVAVEYIGDKMLSLDFGGRQFMIQGHGLNELVERLQQGSVLMVQEFSDTYWDSTDHAQIVRSISRLGV